LASLPPTTDPSTVCASPPVRRQACARARSAHASLSLPPLLALAYSVDTAKHVARGALARLLHRAERRAGVTGPPLAGVCGRRGRSVPRAAAAIDCKPTLLRRKRGRALPSASWSVTARPLPPPVSALSYPRWRGGGGPGREPIAHGAPGTRRCACDRAVRGVECVVAAGGMLGAGRGDTGRRRRRDAHRAPSPCLGRYDAAGHTLAALGRRATN
jgi:hypothetical protein